MGGQLEWEREIFTDAVAAARDGVPVSRSLAAAFREEEARRVRRGFRDTFSPTACRWRATARAARAGRTLEAIRDGGAAALYDGELTAGFVDGLARLGSRIRRGRLLLFHPEVVEPLTTSFGAYRVLTSPPNTHGFAAAARVLRDWNGTASPTPWARTSAA